MLFGQIILSLISIFFGQCVIYLQQRKAEIILYHFFIFFFNISLIMYEVHNIVLFIVECIRAETGQEWLCTVARETLLSR